VKVAIFVCLAAVQALAPLSPAAAHQDAVIHGIDPADMDLSVDPGEDFYRYANGGWFDRTTIPPDFPGIETLSDLEGRTRGQLIDLLRGRAATGDVQVGSDEWKAIRVFEQGTDLATRNAQGLAPIQPTLEEIAAIADLEQLHLYLQTSVFKSTPGLFFISAAPDIGDSSATVAYLNGPSLGMPNRDYYLTDDAATSAVQDAYIATATELLTRAGRDGDDARAATRAVYELETALASEVFSREETQDVSRVYNPTTLEDLAIDYPLMDWPGYLAALGLADVAMVVVTEPQYMGALSGIVRATPLAVLKDFLTLQLLWSSSASLSEVMETTAFAFYGTSLNGLEVMAPVEGRTLDQVNVYLGDALGKLYIETYFPPAAKAQSAELMAELVSAFRQRLEANAWMTAPTKTEALAKIDTIRIKVGYPGQWLDYDDVAIGDSYFSSALSAFNAWYRYRLDQIGEPLDEDAWPFPPQTVNAFYNPSGNEIIVPAAILQPPFFDPDADAASNFGAIGFVIGHEITHGFDLQGAQFDAQGNLNNWWSEEDYERFQALNEEVVAQYAAIEARPAQFINGQITVTENVADLGGIQVAYDALQDHLATHDPPAVDDMALDLTQDQRFFIAAATVWRAEIRDAALITQLASDTHAPASVRATQPLRNCDAFYAAFEIGPGDPMYLPPDERIVIW
ncbi:MAG: M13 family metallopeptidase, partial [Chloroflexota bacterium]|nr:M13 family metallopeptidase [Chloroflexota bacterium]